MFYHQPLPGRRPMIGLGVAITFVIHAGIIGGVFIARAHGDTNKDVAPSVGQFVDVEAVKFGKPRDLSFLPHKAPPKVVKDEPKIKLTDNTNALPRPPEEKKPEKKDDDLQRLKDLAKKLDTTAGEEDSTGTKSTEEGDPNGMHGGGSTVGRGPVYYQHLQAAVQNAWSVPTIISDDELSHLKAQACIIISATGHVTDFRISKASGNERFDATLLEAVQSIKDFEPPTKDVRDVVTTDGVCMNFSKTR